MDIDIHAASLGRAAEKKLLMKRMSRGNCLSRRLCSMHKLSCRPFMVDILFSQPHACVSFSMITVIGAALAYKRGHGEGERRPMNITQCDESFSRWVLFTDIYGSITNDFGINSLIFNNQRSKAFHWNQGQNTINIY